MESTQSLKDRVCIVGLGQSEYTRWGGITDRSEFQLACEVIVQAAADAGIAVAEIDGIASFANDRNEAILLQAALGLPRLGFANLVWGGGGGGACGAVMNAAAAIHAGLARNVVVFRALCQGQFQRFGSGEAYAPDPNFAAPFGLMTPAQMHALLVRRHMHLYGTTSRQLGAVAVACRKHANRNPKAVMHGRPLTIEEHQRSRMIADPLRLYDCCLESDGACAVLLTSADRARDLRRPPVYIMAAAQGNSAGWGAGPAGWQNMPAESYATANLRPVADDLYRMAGLGPADIDVTQIYETFSGMVILSLEDLGFCRPGEGGPFVEGRRIEWPDGELPINTGGGNLSEAYIHGLTHVLEGVRQLRGASTSQVTDAEVCLVTSGPGATPNSGLILRR